MAADGGSIWERWEEIDRILEAVLELPHAERIEAVRAAVGADSSLESAVIRLLGRLDNDHRVSLPSGQLVQEALDEQMPETVRPGDLLGRFRIVSRLGRGGMATVYRAERADGTYEQQVALKLLRRGLDTEDVIRRFMGERQILSSLSHPNIARLLDGGSTADGRPFLVMELVEGESIVAWADGRCLDVAGRLELFLAVADAVHAAHRQLVVHRDIKPSNVLVDHAGQVKLLDFGIAKLLDTDEAHTADGLLPHTPSYASPEQLKGDRITTASDIYQAGILLLELVTGTRPTGDTVGSSSRLASRAATTEMPGNGAPEDRAKARLSTPDRLARRLRGDVDLIIAKALRDEPTERYHSIAEMAEDVRRHLAGRPILAHPESVEYRARKFIARHPLFVPAALVLLVLLAGYLGTLVRHNALLASERDAATEASALATETRDFFVDLFRTADPYGPLDPELGRNITVVEALHLGRARLDSQLVDRPTLQVALLSAIGEVLKNLDQTEEAIHTLQRAVAIRTALGDTTSSEFQHNLEVLGGAYLVMGEPDSALRLYTHELRLARAQAPTDPGRLSAALVANAVVYARMDPAAALPFSEEAVAVARAQGGLGLAEAQRKLADNYRAVGQYAPAEVAAREALVLFRAIEGDSTLRTGFALHTLGQVLAESGQTDEAGPLYRWSLAILDRRLGRQHDLTMRMRNNLGVFHTLAGEHGRAEEVLREMLDDRIARFGERSDQVATSYQNLAAVLLRLGELVEADRAAEHAERIYLATAPPGSPLVAFPRLTRAEIALTGSDYAAGHRLARGAADALRGKVTPTHAAAIMADCRIGRAAAGLGRSQEARLMLDSALARLERSPSSSALHLTECREARASISGG